MTHRNKRLLGLLVIVLVLAAGAGWWVVRSLTPPLKVVLRGPTGSSPHLRISGGNLHVVTPRPGLFFGTVKTPGGPEQFTYVILFRYGRSGSGGASRSIESQCTSDDRTGETKNAIELDGKRVEAGYRVELDEALAGVASERLTIGGKTVDMSAGRVFLIDLTEGTLAYRQKKIDLPALPSKLETAEDVERLAETVRMGLETQDPDVKAFVR